MKKCSKCGKEKELKNYSINNKSKDGLCIYCKSCVSERGKIYRSSNKEKIRIQQRCWEQSNPEKKRAKNKRWRDKDLQGQSERARSWQLANKERDRVTKDIWKSNNKQKILALKREDYKRHRVTQLATVKVWRDSNRAACASYSGAKRARKRNATPSWASAEIIKTIYHQARVLTETTGIIHHVDHVIPLAHKFVCGLHVEHNLQILLFSENLEKHNTFIVE